MMLDFNAFKIVHIQIMWWKKLHKLQKWTIKKGQKCALFPYIVLVYQVKSSQVELYCHSTTCVDI